MSLKALICCAVLELCCRKCAVAEDRLREWVLPTFQEHCVSCHGLEGEVNGEVNLLELQPESISNNLELLQKLIDAIDQREMPPEDELPLPEESRERLLTALNSLLPDAVNQTPSIAHTPIRRMNRFQYHNVVTDLFQLHCAVFSLPERMLREHKNYFRPDTGRMAETVIVGSRPLGKSQLIEPRLDGVAPFPQDLRAEHGFDNRGDHLTLSPLLMEAFVKLGQSITHSPDFTPENVGIWNTFFAPPELSEPMQQTIRERLRPFLSRAFRREVDDISLDRYVAFVTEQIKRGMDFTSAMQSVAAATIASPRFLYLYDVSSRDISGGSTAAGSQANDTDPHQPTSELELASRLSFFLWGSIPDDELLGLASIGKLSDPQVLTAQVERMLRDAKLKRFCDSFPAQWLQLERIISSNPDPGQFPEFYFAKYRASMHMMVEPLLLFETVLIENLSITQLIDSDFTYRSHLLRELYGEEIPVDEKKPGRSGEVATLTFQRLPVADRRHGGVITNAATMTMTSGRNRTQPITRGAWLATVIFNDPPQPPPADVPPLPEKPDEGDEHLTLRERLDLHRERADCRGCHAQIDPLGFALENYNVIGVWREQYENGRSVDMAGQLFRQHPFDNVVEFKDAILTEKDRFTRGFARHLLSYALARQLEPSDAVAVEAIAQATAADNYRMQTLIKHIVLSDPFRDKHTPHKSGP